MLTRRLRYWLRSATRGRQLREEMEIHVAEIAAELEAQGLEPIRARGEAKRRFGNRTRVAEEARDVWVTIWLDHLLNDARFAVRMLRRDWSFTAAAVLTLAVGIGMNTAVFSVINTVLLSPLPHPDAERLMWLANYDEFLNGEIVRGADYFDWKDQSQSFDAMTAYSLADLPFGTSDNATQARRAEVTDGFWDVFGGQAALGSLFGPNDPDSVVLSDRFFEQFFARDPGVIGRQAILGTQAVTIMGVLPPDFHLSIPRLGYFDMGSEVDIFATSPLMPANANGRIVRVIGKLKPAVSLAAARAEMETIQKRVAETNSNSQETANPIPLQIVPLQERLVRDVRPGLLVLMAAVGLVLMIAAVNVASLLLARSTVRKREIAIRAAMGAGVGRLLRQLISESAVLGMLGGLAGILFAKGAVGLMIRLSPQSVPRLEAAAVDHRGLLFTLGIVVCSVTVFSFAPATAMWRSGLGSLMDGRTFSATVNSVRMRRFLVGVEVGLAVVLLCAAGLMIRSFWEMKDRSPGFAPERILASSVRHSRPDRTAYAADLLRRLENAPGVQAATVMSAGAFFPATIEGADGPQDPQGALTLFNAVSADFGRVLGLRLIEGRWLTDREASPAVLVNESFARRVLLDEEPVGKRLRIPLGDAMASSIVGVVSNLKYTRLDAEPEPEVYIPYAQSPSNFSLRDVLVRISGDVAATAPGVRAAIAQVDGTPPVFALATMEERLADSIAPTRFNTFLLGTFAGAALLLTLVGIFGVVAYSITQRAREIAVRIALGARAGQVMRMIVREGMTIVLVGAVAGLVAASVLTQGMTSLLYGIDPTDAPTLVSVTLLVVAGGLLATLNAAMRAARMDPSVTLRSE